MFSVYFRNYAEKVYRIISREIIRYSSARVRSSKVEGYRPRLACDFFRILNTNTKHMIMSRDVIWLNETYGFWKAKSQGGDIRSRMMTTRTLWKLELNKT
jgi:hypothetical protein